MKRALRHLVTVILLKHFRLAPFSILIHLVAYVAYAALTSAAHADSGRVILSVNVSEEYATNIDLEPDDQKESAVISRLTPGARYRKEGGRHSTALDVFGTLRHQTAGDDEGFDFDFDLSATSEVEAIEDRVFIDAGASISQQVLSSDQVNSAANQRMVQVYRISPVWRARIGSYADGEFRYALNQVILDEQSSDQTDHSLRLNLTSGERVDRLTWSLSGLASEAERSSASDVSRREIEASGEYAVSRYFFIKANLGLQSYDDNDATDFDSPIWQAGIRLKPNRKFEWKITYGQRDDEESLSTDLRYDIGARTTLTAGYHETLSTSQARLSRNLSSIGVDPETDAFIDRQANAPFNPKTDPFDIDNQTERIKRFDASLRNEQKRNLFILAGTYAEETKRGSGEEEINLRLDLSWQRKMSRDLSLTASVGFERIDFDSGQRDDEYLASGALQYKLSETLNASASYFFREQYSDNPQSEFVDHRFTVGLRKEF